VAFSFEQELHRHLQNCRNALQAAGADAVRAFFIFLHLLERHAERVAEIRLGHIKHQAAHANALPHVFVSRMYSILRHSSPVSLAPR